jgi:hypothetical protein
VEHVAEFNNIKNVEHDTHLFVQCREENNDVQYVVELDIIGHLTNIEFVHVERCKEECWKDGQKIMRPQIILRNNDNERED